MYETYVRRLAEREREAFCVTDAARAVASSVMSPPVPIALRPAVRLLAQLGLGLMPPRLRAAYGIRWTRVDAAALAASARAVRTFLPATPSELRELQDGRGRARLPLQALAAIAR